MESHLLQMRGLKHYKSIDKRGREVASFTDAWIETGEIGSAELELRRIFYRCVD